MLDGLRGRRRTSRVERMLRDEPKQWVELIGSPHDGDMIELPYHWVFPAQSPHGWGDAVGNLSFGAPMEGERPWPFDPSTPRGSYHTDGWTDEELQVARMRWLPITEAEWQAAKEKYEAA